MGVLLSLKGFRRACNQSHPAFGELSTKVILFSLSKSLLLGSLLSESLLSKFGEPAFKISESLLSESLLSESLLLDSLLSASFRNESQSAFVELSLKASLLSESFQ